MHYFCCVVLLGSLFGIATAQQVTFDFRSTVTPAGDKSDFFDLDDNIRLVCTADPGSASYTIHIRVNDSDTGEITRLTNSALAERQPATIAVNVSVMLNTTTYQCFASHNDPNGLDETATFTTFINPFFTIVPNDPLLLENGAEISSLCVANGRPVPNVQLLREDVVIDDPLEPTDVVTFNFGDGGMHQCFASTPGADKNATFNFTVIISPVGSVRINESDFMNGDTEIVLNCSTGGGPGNNFTWFKGNTTISNDDTDFIITATTDTRQEVRITNLISGSLVMYTCVVENLAGQENATIDIQVPIQNFLDVAPTNQSVDLETEARFVCSNPGLQPNEFFWIRNLTNPTSNPNIDLIDLTMPNNPYIITNGPILIISDVSLDDGGVYACVSNVTEVTVVEPAVLSVNPNITNTLMEMFVEEGDRVVFPCMATGFPTPTYHWEKMNMSTGMFEEILNETNDELVIDPVQFENFGRYRCVATVDFLQTNIDLSNHVLLHVSPAGSVITSPMVVTEEHGQNVSLHCDSQGGPNNMYFWVRNASEEVCLDCAGVVDFKTFLEGIALSADTIEILSFEQYLNINDLNATQHGGAYFCVVINEAGYGISVSTVNVVPAFVAQPQDFKTDVGQAATFSCEAQSFPSPSYRWEKLPSMPIEDVSGPVLVINPVTFSSFGDYRCIAYINVSGQINETASEAATLFVSPLGSVLSIPPGPVLLDQGESFTLTCLGMGGPNNTYVYLLGDNIIDSSTQLFTTATLSSSSLQVEVEADAALHKGLYTCVVSNMAGNDTGTTEVIISPFGIVSVNPNNITSSREMNVSFLCDTDSGPNNNYFWFKNLTMRNASNLTSQERSDLAISTEQTLVLQSITAADGGLYTCLATNLAGVGEASGTLNLVPEFVVQPQGANTTVGSTLTLTCVAEAFPSPSTQWQKMNRMTGVFEDIPSQTSTTLTFSPVEYSDFGMYRCQAFNTINGDVFSEISDNALVVVSPEGSILLTPQNDTFDFQSTANLTCVVEGGPLNDFRWFLNDTELVSGTNNVTITSTLLYSVLDISSVSAPVHGGTFRCEVTNPAGSDQNSTLLFVSPRFLEEPVSVTLSQNGSTVILVCRAEAFPVPRYSWINTLPWSTVGDPQPLLVFSPVVFGAESVYVCSVSSNDLTIISQTSTLHVSPLGSAIVTPQVENGLHGLNYSSVCSGLGGLNNQFSWTYLRTGVELVTMPTLDLLNVDILQAGQYQCTVSNQAGNDSAIYTLNIGPRIVEQPQAINVTIDIEDIMLSCTATGFPLPTISWLHNDTVVSVDGESVTIESIPFTENPLVSPSDFGRITSILTIYNATTNDTGLYKCVADNGIPGPAESEEALVLVQDVPQVPHTISDDELFSQNLTLVWFEPHDNNAPILGYYVFYTNPSFIDSGSQRVLTVYEAIEELDVLELHPGVEYSFTIIAFNEIGNSSASDPFVVTTLEEEPSGPPLDVRGTSGSPTSIILSWMLPEEIQRRGVIVSYDIHYEASDDDTGNIIDQGIINTNMTFFILTGLMEFTNYSIRISARTDIGPGPLSEPEYVLTNETFPGPIDEPAVGNIDSTSALVSWSPPDDPNGMIVSYDVEYSPVRFNESVFSTSGRRRRQVFVDQSVINCANSLNLSNNGSNVITVEGTRTFQLLTGLIPFTEYIARVRAVTVVGPGNYSNSTTFNTREAAPGPVIILEAIAVDGSSARIKWSAPLCPNGPVTGYKVYHRRSTVAQTNFPITNRDDYIVAQVNSRELIVTFVIDDLDQGTTYAVHVQAIYSNGTGVEIKGEVVQEVTVTIENEVIPPTMTDGPETVTGSNTARIGLPPVADFSTSGITDIRYYGVVVVPDPISDFKLSERNFDETYPNVQPFDLRGNNKHYITVAWNNMSAIPGDFVIGDETTTTARRNGIAETYFNAKLDPNTMHCIYVLIHYSTDGSNDLLVRYAELECVKTDRGYHLVGLIIGIILAFLLLCCLLILLIILLICCCKRRRRSKYSDYYSPPEARPMKEVNKPFSEPDTIIGNVYASNSDVPSKTSVPVMQYPQYVRNMHSNNNFLFTEEYRNIEPQHTPSKTSSLANKSKDRYLNIPAYDHSRVVLKHCPTGTNYINANYISGYGKDANFIATQGPMASTTTDFWYMVWEQDVTIIVMLTNLEEKGKVKCHKYWPNSPHEGENLEAYGSLQVEFLEEKKEDHQIVRTFHLSMEGSTGRQIKQYHFIAWPDHGVPSSSEALLEFVDQVKDKYNVADGPTVVHCSAGVGRTGAFIALYVQMVRSEKEGTIDIHQFVQYMRKQRPSMVLNETEYIFVHDALVQALRMGLIKDVNIDFTAYDEKEKTPLDNGGSVEVEAENDFSFEEGILGSNQENGSSM